MNIQFKDKDLVRLEIAKKGLSAREFSKQINVSQSYLSQLLNSKKTLAAKTAYKISEGLGLPFESVFTIKTVDKTNTKVGELNDR